jgi:glucosamine--fructose-6-phosphate aminotransferase (isomerizing)
MTSAMLREIAESPDAVAGLVARGGEIAALARDLAIGSVPFVVLCGRGSSGHVGTLLRYLIETRLGLAVSTTAPSVTTLFHSRMRLRGALFVVISQSGGSSDLVAATEAARASGARTLAIVNVTDSPVARAAEFVLDIGVGPELSVAATKSVIASMAACVALMAAWAEASDLADAVARLPARLARASALDWSGMAADVLQAPAAFVTARGFGLGPAREIALKLAETTRLPTLAYSAAELLHGPRASISRVTPVLALGSPDAAGPSVADLVLALREAEVPVHDVGGSLPWIADDHAVTDPIAMLMPAYAAIEAMTRAKGFDPDHPPFLRKVTSTV